MSPRPSHADRRAAGLDVLRTLRGGAVDPLAAAAAQEDELGALGSFVVDTALGELWTRPAFSRRDRSLVVIAMLTALNQLNQLRSHTVGGLTHGLTPEEIGEVMVTAAAYAGFPRAINGMRTVRDVFAQHSAGSQHAGSQHAGSQHAGSQHDSGALPPLAPAGYKDGDQRRADGLAVMDRLFGGADSSPGFNMRPLGRFVVDFAFGEVWAREQLSRRDRSLAVCAILIATGKTDELAIHFPGALNHGVTEAEVEELILTAAAYAGFPSAVDGMRVWRGIRPNPVGA